MSEKMPLSERQSPDLSNATPRPWKTIHEWVGHQQETYAIVDENCRTVCVFPIITPVYPVKENAQLIVEAVNNYDRLSALERSHAKLLAALRDANDLCRSAYQIAARSGQQTNWDTFIAISEKVLKNQHAAILEAESLNKEAT